MVIQFKGKKEETHPFSIKRNNHIISWAGGVKSSMYKELPGPLVAEFGFQGCLASLELNGVVVDPNKVGGGGGGGGGGTPI